MNKRTRKRLLILVGVVAGVSVLGGGAATLHQHQRTKMSQEAHALGMAAYEEKDYPRTIQHLGRYLGRNKNDSEALYAVADALRNVPRENQRHLDEARLYARQAIEHAENKLPGLELLLEIEVARGLVLEAMRTADRILQINPNHYDALGTKAQAHLLRGEFADARREVDKLTAAYPDDLAAHELKIGVMMAGGSSRTDVRQYADRAADERPSSFGFALLRVRAAGQTGDFNAAVEGLLQAAEMPIPDVRSLATLSRIADAIVLRGGLPTEMSRRIATLPERLIDQELQRGTIEGDLRALAADRVWKAGRADEAQAILKDAVRDIGDASAHALGLNALLTPGLNPEMLQRHPAYAELSRRGTAESRTWQSILDGAVAISNGRFAEARGSLESVPNSSPFVFTARFYLAHALQRLNETEAAEKLFGEVVQNEPRWLAAWLARAATLVDLNRLTEAHASAHSGVMSQPNSVAAAMLYSEIAALRSEAGELDPEARGRAEAILDELIIQNAEIGDAIAMRARIHMGAGELRQARGLIGRLTSEGLRPSNTGLLSLLDSARKHLTQDEVDALAALADQQDDPNVVYARAVLAAEAGRVEEGRSMLRTAIGNASGQQRFTAELALGKFLARIADAEAVPFLLDLSQRYPGEVAAQTALLEAEQAWTDPASVKPAIDRLRAITGENAATWRVYEGRRLLATRQAADASAAIAVVDGVARRGNATAKLLRAEANLVLGDQAAAVGDLADVLDTDPSRTNVYPWLINLLQQRGDSEGATVRLNQFMRIADPPEPLRRARAELLMNQGMWREAVADLETLAGDSPRDRVALARAYTRAGRTAEARAIYENGLEQPTPDPLLIAAAAEFFGGEGDTDRAIAALRLLPEEVGQSRRDLARARLLVSAGRSAEAEPILRSLAAEESEITAEAGGELVRLFLRSGRGAEAQVQLGDLLRRHPNNAPLRAIAGVLKLMEGTIPVSIGTVADALADVRFEASVGVLASLMERQSRGELSLPDMIRELRQRTIAEPTFYPAWHILALAQLRAGDPNSAVATAQQALGVMPMDPAPARLATEILAGSNRLEEALNAARELRARSAGATSTVDLIIAQLQLGLGNASAALETLRPLRERILATADSDPAPMELLAAVLASMGRLDDAESLLRERAERDAHWARVYLRVGRQLSAPPEAIEAWLIRADSMLNEDAADRLLVAEAWYNFALASGNAATFERVVAALQPIANNTTLRAPVSVLLGLASYHLGQVDAAIQHYSAAIDADPNIPTALNNLASIYLERPGMADRAVPLARRAVQIAESNPQQHARSRRTYIETLGLALIQNQQAEEARTLFNNALRESPLDPRLLLGLAKSLIPLDRMQELDRALAQFPSPAARAIAATFVAQGLEQAGHLPFAERLYRTAINLDPDQYVALNNLAYLLVRGDGTAEEAVTFATRAVGKASESRLPDREMANFLDTLGAAYLKAGRKAEAEETYRRADTLLSESPLITLGLAEALIAQGKTSEASSVLERISAQAWRRASEDPALAARITSARDAVRR